MARNAGSGAAGRGCGTRLPLRQACGRQRAALERVRSGAGAILEKTFCRRFPPDDLPTSILVSNPGAASPAATVTCRGTSTYRGGEEGSSAGLGRPCLSYERRRTLLFDNSDSGRGRPRGGRGGREGSIASPPGPLPPGEGASPSRRRGGAGEGAPRATGASIQGLPPSGGPSPAAPPAEDSSRAAPSPEGRGQEAAWGGGASWRGVPPGRARRRRA